MSKDFNEINKVMNEIFGKDVVTTYSDLLKRVFTDFGYNTKEDANEEKHEENNETKPCNCGKNNCESKPNTARTSVRYHVDGDGKIYVFNHEAFTKDNVFTFNMFTPGYSIVDFKVMVNKKTNTLKISRIGETTNKNLSEKFTNNLNSFNYLEISLPENIDYSSFKKICENGIFTISANVNVEKPEDIGKIRLLNTANDDDLFIYDVTETSTYKENEKNNNIDNMSNAEYVKSEDFQKYTEYVNGVLESVKKISEESQKNNTNDDPKFEKLIKYTESIAEKVNKMEEYSNYLAKRLDKSINYSNYLA